MKRLFALVILSGWVFGCAQSAGPSLTPSEIDRIIADGRRLLEKYPDDTVFEIPKADWPESFRVLKPVLVRRYGDGIGVLQSKFVSKENGFLITLPSHTPHNSGSARFEKIADGLYKYSI